MLAIGGWRGPPIYDQQVEGLKKLLTCLVGLPCGGGQERP